LTLCCNMVLSITGSAVLGIGAQMKTMGWILTPMLLFVGAALTSEMVWIVSATSDEIEERAGVRIVSYQDFAQHALGQPGWWASAVSSTLSLVGILIGGLVLESENLQIIAPISWHWPGSDPSDAGRRWWTVLVTSTTFLYSVADIGKLLHKSGLIGIALTVLCLVLVYTGAFQQFGSSESFAADCKNGVDVPYHSLGLNSNGHQGFDVFLSFFSVTSYCIFVFAIVVTLPTLRSTMQHKEKLTPMSVIAFAVVALEFLGIMLAYYGIFGNLGPQNIVDGMRVNREAHPGWWATTDPWSTGDATWVAKALGWCVTLHLLCSDAIYVPCTVVAIEALLPQHMIQRKRVWLGLRVLISLLRLFIATMVRDFVKLTNLTSAAFVTMNNLMLPVMAFYYAGPSQRAGSFRRTVHLLIFLFSIFSMVFGTISAVLDLVHAASAPDRGVFPRPGITQECHHRYCALNPGHQGCATAYGDIYTRLLPWDMS